MTAQTIQMTFAFVKRLSGPDFVNKLPKICMHYHIRSGTP